MRWATTCVYACLIIERGRQRETERDRERETERDRQTERERDRESIIIVCGSRVGLSIYNCVRHGSVGYAARLFVTHPPTAIAFKLEEVVLRNFLHDTMTHAKHILK